MRGQSHCNPRQYTLRVQSANTPSALGQAFDCQGTKPTLTLRPKRPALLYLQEGRQESQASLIQQLKSQCNGMAAVLPFASTTVIKASSSGQAEIYYGLAKALDVSGGQHRAGVWGVGSAIGKPAVARQRSTMDWPRQWM